MDKKFKKNGGTILFVVLGIVLIGIISYVVLTSNQTIKVWVPSKALSVGEVIDENELQQIDIPTKTPGNYIKNKDLIIGYKLKSNVEQGQLLYSNDFLASWESYNQDTEIPEDYVITSIQVPDSRACGGLIVAGDSIDVLGVSSSGRVTGFENGSTINGREDIGVNVYYILSNVKVINTNSSLSKSQENDLSQIVNDQGEGNYYIVALSYDDFKKLRQAEGVLELWLNIAPRQNEENPPLINQMIGQSFSDLHDAQVPVQDKEGNVIIYEENTKEETKQNENKENKQE